MNSSSDSIYINGDSSNNKPYWATQKYEQQTSLSTQFITSKYQEYHKIKKYKKNIK